MNQKRLQFLLVFIIVLLGIKIASDYFFISLKCAVYFTPDDPCTQKIVDCINSARYKILVQACWFTSRPIAKALIAAKKRGVDVMMIIDYTQQSAPLILEMMQYFPIFVDHPIGLAHNKVMIIDDEIVLTGSFNFTLSAQRRNIENSIHLYGKEIAKEYTRHWFSRRYHAKTYALTETTITCA
jgi:phosphatidylserine/phosphatidylglycerophosphate/cardiolipin synthase-like enzyme